MKSVVSYYHLNRGIISRLALARLDVKRTAFSAEQMTNWVPRVLGSMMLRPGFQFLGGMASRPKLIPFVFATDDTAIIEATNLALRFWIGDTLLSRAAVSSVITNGNFDANLANWTDLDEAGAASVWAAGGYMQLTGDGANAAIREQQVTVAAADQGKEHALRITIQRGPVTLRVGSTSGGDEYVTETELGTGTHSLAFTPTGNFYVRFLSRLLRLTLVDSVQVEGAGVVTLPSPWTENDLRRIRWDQSADVIFVACKGLQQRRIERHSGRSWSVVLYQSNDGPFRVENVGPITIATSALNGNVTLTASKALFRTTQVGGLIKIRSTGQRVSSNIAAQNTFTNTIRVTGVGESRRFTWQISGVWTGTVTLQRSVGTVGFWEDVFQRTTTDINESDNDGLDNQVVYYRLGFKTGDYGSGTATCTITYTLGSITGVARITDFTNATTVGAEVYADFGGIDASLFWSEGSWSDRRGWPTAVALYEGRLWWAGKNGIWGSISDAFNSFDENFEGAAGPINRTVGSGPVDDINWALPLQRLLLGAGGAEHSVRSTTFDEPLSPTNFNIKEASTQGSAPCHAVKVDSRGIYVQRSTQRIYELAFDTQSYDYGSSDLTVMCPDIAVGGIVGLAVQRQPDTRIHAIRTDGTVALGVIDRAENVLSWQIVQTEGSVLDAVVLPGIEEDAVYYAVQRSLGPTGITSLDVTPGTAFTAQATLAFTGGGGENAAATIDLKVVNAVVSATGAGYFENDVMTVVGGTIGVGATLRVQTVDGAGGVLTVSIVQAGDYTAIPANPAATINGTGAGCTVTLTWGLGPYTITDSGSGYSTAPEVTVIGDGNGSSVTATISSVAQTGYYLEKWAKESECRGGTLNKQADAFITIGSAPSSGGAIVLGGYVSSLTVDPGINYADLPTGVTISGGGGGGATATIGLGAVGADYSGTAGSGYTPGDVLTVVGGVFTRPAKLRNVTPYSGPAVFLDVIDPGVYSVRPINYVSVSGGTGSGLVTYIVWGLSEATITNPGSGYTSPPTVTAVMAGPYPSGFFAGGVPGTISASITLVTGPAAPSGGANSISGLDHLEGKEVIVWGDGKDLSPDDDNGVQQTYTVSGGSINLDTSVSQAVVGLPYTATWVSAKLALGTDQGTTLNQRKRISQLGLCLVDTHSHGLLMGSGNDPVTLDQMPLIEGGAEIPYDQIWLGYDADSIPIPGEWSTDSRLHLVAKAPRPCTVLAITMAVEENTKG